MISLQRSMHSSQIYTPGPAMSFLTCFWLFPQNEHFSRSPPSPMRATRLLPLAAGRSGRPGLTLCRYQPLWCLPVATVRPALRVIELVEPDGTASAALGVAYGT